jgi:hypothetical protein
MNRLDTIIDNYKNRFDISDDILDYIKNQTALYALDALHDSSIRDELENLEIEIRSDFLF